MTSPASEPSSQLGKYRLLGELGHGGMAHVYLAMVTGPARFNKLVVVKEIQAELAREPEFVMMFLDEARLAARLNHPNVVQTNEVGQEEYRFFMVMEHLEGQTLRTALRRIGRGPEGPMTVHMKVRVLCEALAGLHHAHELTDFDGTPLGVVHRDVSPHNIFITYSGQVKVLDFGIAKAMDSVSTTSTGVLKGKVAYMAPEHARGDKVDRRADVYAAGIVLWESVTGHRLFRELPQVAILNKLLTGDIPRASDVDPGIDPNLDAIIAKAMAFDRDHRYPTAAAMAHDLELWLRERGDVSSCREVGELLSVAFADERARIQALVESQIRCLNDEPTRVVPVPLFEDTTRSSSMVVAPLNLAPPANPSSLTPPTMSGVSSVVVNATQDDALRPTRSRWPWIAAGVALAGVLATVVMLRPDAPDPAAPAVPAATFTLRIESTPTGATVTCDGKEVGKTPLDVAMRPDERPCPFLLVLDGHEPYKLERGPLSSDTTVAASLPPASATSADEPMPTATSPQGPRPNMPRPAPPPPVEPPPPVKPKDDIRLKR